MPCPLWRDKARLNAGSWQKRGKPTEQAGFVLEEPTLEVGFALPRAAGVCQDGVGGDVAYQDIFRRVLLMALAGAIASGQ